MRFTRRGAAVAIVVATAVALLLGADSVRPYAGLFRTSLSGLDERMHALYTTIETSRWDSPVARDSIRSRIRQARVRLKAMDFWLRYLEPVAYDRLNGPLPIEWETEVFEKFEKPYIRVGGGLSLAELALEDSTVGRDSVRALVAMSLDAIRVMDDLVPPRLTPGDHFFLANRLFLLNLAAIYTTGFECPDPDRIVPELRGMLGAVQGIYAAYGRDFPERPLTAEYLAGYARLIAFVRAQPDDANQFDHFTFIRDHVNPLFTLNQRMIRDYAIRSRSTNDYTLNNECASLFDKTLYSAQNTKGVYSLIRDPGTLDRIRETGRLLFFDPLLSANNQRSCASCHDPRRLFTDSTATPLEFDRHTRLPRNAPSLIDVVYNHLIMLDGKHQDLQAQAKAVITNPIEMGSTESDVVAKVMSCRQYRDAFTQLRKRIPEEKAVTLDHIASAITFYYEGFSQAFSPFDEAMNNGAPLAADAHRGFNLFMSKGQCATCHFVPQFNGVKPPFVESEFEVLGVPEDSAYHALSHDNGRHDVHAVPEMLHAFRTTTVRNADRTAPYMHNGVFRTLDQVIDFYDKGGGQGRGLNVGNQTLPPDTLGLTALEKADLLAFIRSLDERVPEATPPAALPKSKDSRLNARRVGGEY